jgi:hypothetical protein
VHVVLKPGMTTSVTRPSGHVMRMAMAIDAAVRTA